MQMLDLIVPTFGIIVTGWLVGRWGILPPNASDSLIQFAYYIAMPALLFVTVAKEPPGALMDWRFIASFGGGSVIVFLAVLAVAWRLGKGDPARSTMWALMASMTNTGFVALPLLHSIFGARAVLPTAIATLFVAVILFPLGVGLLEMRGTPQVLGRSHAMSGMVTHSLRNPLVSATLLGLAFAASGLTLPGMFDDYLGIFAAALAPCALFAIGLGIELAGLRAQLRPALGLSVVKLLALPALVYALGRWLGLDPLSMIAATICAAVPTAKTVYILAAEYEIDRELVAMTVTLTTVGSIVTLFAWLTAMAHVLPGAFPR
ncbi:MAG TPA: AEC family transporter [Methylomirabilota bacterium]|nr:AEC family transporter [Methylomirabilota bacterium]